MAEYIPMRSILEGKLFDNEKLVQKLGYYNKEKGDFQVTAEYWLTDRNRLVGCVQTREYISFLHFEYEHNYCSYDLNALNPDCISLFKSGEYEYELSMTFQSNGLAQTVNLTLASICGDAKRILQDHLKKYQKKPTVLTSSPINDIRKMYEDNLITKEEMLDLIRTLKL